MTTPLFSSIRPSDLFSKFKPESRFWKTLNFPLIRIVVIALFLVPIMAINGVVVFSVIEQVEEPLATYIDIVRMITEVKGPVWLTGGAIGIEGSWLAFSADLIIGLLVLYVAVKAGKIVAPRWRR